MQNDNGALYFRTGIDNSQLRADAEQSKQILHGIGQSAVEEGNALETAMKRVGEAVAGVFAIGKLKKFGVQVAKTRGEFQQLEIAFNTMLGNKEQADALMQQLVKTASTTPFGMSDIAKSAKQLLAYGLEADKVNETLIRLGDIASGLSIPIGDLAYLYGTTMVQGRMYTQDLNQFLNRGIPLAKELADQFNVNEKEVRGLVEAGKVGFPEVEKAIVSLTSEGSKFGGLMAEQSKTISGQISNIEDEIEQMFNEIGKSSEGVLNKGIEIVSSIVKHWKSIGTILLTTVSAYGVAKGALIAFNAVLAIHKRLVQEAALQKRLAAMQSIALSNAEAMASARTTLLSRAMHGLKVAIASNPIGVILSVVATATTAFMIFKEKIDATREAQRKLDNIKEESAKKAGEEISKIELLIKAAKNEHLALEERKRAVNQLNKIIPNYNAQLDDTSGKYRENKLALDSYLKSLQKKYELEGAKGVLAEIGRKKAEARVKYNRAMAEEDSRGYKDDNKVIGGTIAQVANNGVGAVTYKQARLERKKTIVAEYRKDMAEIANEEKAINDLYGKDLQEDIVKKTTETTTAGNKGGGKKKDNTKDEIAERKKAIEAYKDEIEAQNEEASLDIRQEEIKLLEDGTKKQELQIRLNYDRLIAENKKRAKQMVEELKENKLNEWLNLNPKANKAQLEQYRDSLNLTIKDLTGSQQAQLNAYYEIAGSTQKQAIKKLADDRLLAERQSINNLLKEYGTYEQRKQALIDEAEQRKQAVRDNGTLTDKGIEAQIKTIESELNQSINDLNFKHLKDNINWEYIFGDLDHTMPEVVSAVKDQLQKFIDTAKELTPEQIKTVTDALENLQERMDMSEPIKTIKQAKLEFKAAKQEYDKYLTAFNRAKEAGDKTGQENASKGMIRQSQLMTKASNSQKRAYKQVIDIAKDYAGALSDLGDVMGDSTGKMLKLASSAISCGLSMAQGIDAFGKAVSKMERSVAILAIIQAALQAIQLVLSFFGGEDKRLQRYIDGMGRYVSILKENVSELSESLKDVKNTIVDTLSVFDKLQDKRRKTADAIKAKSEAWLNSGASSGFFGIGSKASEGRKIADDLDGQFEEALAKYKKKWQNWGRMTWIWELTDEELVKLSEDAMAMAGLGDELAGHVKDYVEQIKALQEGNKERDEALLGLSFDDFYNDFADMLKDMDKDSANFANNFAEYMQRAMMRDVIAKKYKERLADIYKETAKAMDNGSASKETIDSIKAKYKELYDDARKDMEAITEITGYKGDGNAEQQASSNGVANITYEQATSITELTTAGNISRDQLKDIATSMQGSLVGIGNSISEMRNISLLSMNHLEDIAKYTKHIYTDFAVKIDDVNKNLIAIK